MMCHSEQMGERAGERGCRPERAPLESRRLSKNQGSKSPAAELGSLPFIPRLF